MVGGDEGKCQCNPPFPVQRRSGRRDGVLGCRVGRGDDGKCKHSRGAASPPPVRKATVIWQAGWGSWGVGLVGGR